VGQNQILDNNTQMKNISIGTPIDLQKLVDTRLLIQAGSGGGKSYALRRVAEAVGNQVQQIILDPEGEFVTLREKFDFVLVGKDGDIPLSLRYAETLAHRILETHLSAIIDLYELKHHERILFVKRFLDALVNAPKELWHSCLVYVDEAHIFCPESTKSESAGSVIDLCTRGRKRGYCAILATQRLSKLHKDAAAECLNKMIGRTGLDIDRKRSGEELGMISKADIINLRELQPGEFYCFGPALTSEVKKFTVSKVATTHLQSGKRIATAPPTPNAVKKILSKLKDIPEEAERELTTKQELQKEVTRLRSEVTKSQTEIKKLYTLGAATENPETKKRISELQLTVKAKDQEISQLSKIVKSYEIREHKILELLKTSAPIIQKQDIPKIQQSVPKIIIPVQEKRSIVSERRATATSTNGSLSMGKCSKEIIRFLAQYPERKFSKAQVAIATGYSPGSGGFNNSLSELNSRKFLIRDQGKLQVDNSGMDEIMAAVGPIEYRNYDINTYKNQLGKCEREIYEVLLDNPHDQFTKEEISQRTATEYSPGSGGFNNSLSRLNTLELIKRSGGRIQLNPELLEIG
jgi:hypothetical protein